jgi:tRNA-specific 2-thiouridylase
VTARGRSATATADHGTWFYTVGQRRGLGLAGGPWYVCATDVGTSTVWVAHGERLAEHARSEVRVADAHWIVAPPEGRRLEIRVRHGQQPVGCDIDLVGRGFVARMGQPDTGIAPGQIAVVSSGDEVLGGGVIAG